MLTDLWMRSTWLMTAASLLMEVADVAPGRPVCEQYGVPWYYWYAKGWSVEFRINPHVIEDGFWYQLKICRRIGEEMTVILDEPRRSPKALRAALVRIGRGD